MGRMKKLIIVIGILTFVLLGSFMVLQWLPRAYLGNDVQIGKFNGVENDYILYKGKEGKDALSLLKETTTVEQDSSGLVISIKGRKADSAKHEYWAFYVNKKMASVGPADYKTRNEDVIEWKIDKY